MIPYRHERMGPARAAVYDESTASDEAYYVPRAARGYAPNRLAMRRQVSGPAVPGTAPRPNGPVAEEVMPGQAMEGEVIYDGEYSDGYMQGPAMHGEVFEGDYGGPGCAECCDGGPFYWGGGLPFLPHLWHHRTWGITAGAEALFVRPHFSQPVALTATTTSQPSQTALVQYDGINWDNTYQGAFRAYLGLRNLACGDELRFSYWNFSADNNLSAIADQDTNYCDFLCNQTANPGDVIATGMSLQVNVFDLDWIKPFCVPAPCDSCDSCGSCGDCDCCEPCGPCCPIWDVRWFAGIRFAQINRYLDSSIVTSQESTVALADSEAKFFGVGPRLGMQVRRYFDSFPRLSLYGRGSGSLLVGNLDQQINNYNATDPATQSIAINSFNRVVPVAELELGASWCFLPRWTVTGGWAAWAFWDLGIQERTVTLDTANILGFDGFFVRLETIF